MFQSVGQACEKAKDSVTELGMSELWKKHCNWDNPPVCFWQSDEVFKDEDDLEEDEVAEYLAYEDNVAPEEALSEISQLSNAKLIDDEMASHLTTLHWASFKKVENSALLMYELQINSSSKNLPKHKHFKFVEVECGDKSVFIHKTNSSLVILRRGKGYCWSIV